MKTIFWGSPNFFEPICYAEDEQLEESVKLLSALDMMCYDSNQRRAFRQPFRDYRRHTIVQSQKDYDAVLNFFTGKSIE